MPDANENGKKGFSGLSELASEVSDIIADKNTVVEHLTSEKSTQASHEINSHDSGGKSNSTLPYETIRSGKASGAFGWKWILGIVVVACLIWFTHVWQSEERTYGNPNSNSTPAVRAVGVSQNKGLQYIKPTAGTDNVLTVPEIRWCVREGIRIEAMRVYVNTNEGIDEFNRIVNDYNARCGSYRYRQGNQSQAEKDVEPFRNQIATNAISEARQLGSRSKSLGGSVSSVSTKPNAKSTKEAQKLLTELGYSPGPVDGQYGRRTFDAVKAFQRDIGITPNGWIDTILLGHLRRVKAESKQLGSSKPKPQGQASTEAESNNPPSVSKTPAGSFTRGSHQDEVLRLQGTPDAINDYSALGYEEWKYGYSSVNISTKNRRVISWTNRSNLKVRLSAGPNTTSAQYFTRNSHQDEVLRLQGTPDAINDYSALGYEEWKYGYSSVNISTKNRRVIGWANQSGILKVN